MALSKTLRNSQRHDQNISLTFLNPAGIRRPCKTLFLLCSLVYNCHCENSGRKQHELRELGYGLHQTQKSHGIGERIGDKVDNQIQVQGGLRSMCNDIQQLRN
uniref:Uncharacterized protein n=1 Tax=Opuntia streptacantha TaxID=393608 RepID=A0A7C9A345_OPUST